MLNIDFCAPLQRNWRVMWEGVRSSQKATRIYLYLSKFFMSCLRTKERKKKTICVVLRTEFFQVFFSSSMSILSKC